MPLRAPQVYPGDQRSFDQWTRQVAVTPDTGSVTTITVADKAITDSKLRDSQPTSVIGRTTNSPGPPADIVAGADDRFLVRRAGALAFGTIGDTDIPSTIARDTEVAAGDAAVTTAFQAADVALEATILGLSDPFTQYFNQARGDARYVQLANVLNGSATYDPPSLTTGTEASTTVTVTGAALGDFCLASFSLSTQGIKLACEVTAANTVTVTFANGTGGTIDLASATLRARVWKQ